MFLSQIEEPSLFQIATHKGPLPILLFVLIILAPIVAIDRNRRRSTKPSPGTAARNL